MKAPNSRRKALTAMYAYFARNLRQGRVVSYERLLAYAKHTKLPLRKLHLLTHMRNIRRHFKVLNVFGRAQNPHLYVAGSYWHIGTVQVDLAHFRPDLKKKNSGCAAFLLGVQTVGHQLVALPVKNKTTRAWLAGLKKMIDEHYAEVSVLVSDRDTAVNARLRKTLYDRYGITWYHSKARSKAYLAERFIHYVKQHLSIGLMYNNTERWIDLLPVICANFNEEIYPHTTFRRNAINRDNYLQFLAQLHRVSDATLLFNSYSMKRFSKDMARHIFRIPLGAKVRIRRRTNYQDRVGKKVFAKTSVEGSFAPQLYTVVGRALKHTRSAIWTPTYKIAGHDQVFYQNDLRLAHSDY